jgi:uncharacterized protein (DUF1697 family)
MATKLEKCAKSVNDAFAERLETAFAKKFKRKVETRFNIFSMALVSQPADGKPFTQEQKDWVAAFDAGYSDAMQVVRDMAQGAA